MTHRFSPSVSTEISGTCSWAETDGGAAIRQSAAMAPSCVKTDVGDAILREAGLRFRINLGIFMGDNLRGESLNRKGAGQNVGNRGEQRVTVDAPEHRPALHSL
jgi:hypothetical protein